MSNEGIPLLERVASYYSQLSSVASDLNAVSDELGKSISDIDAALKKLNLGLSAWVAIRSGPEDMDQGGSSFWSRDIGYAKIGGKWGIGLRTVEGDYMDPDREEVEEWLFNDAPRSLRLEAIDKIPELLEKLSSNATETTKNIRAKLSEAQAVAGAIKCAVDAPVQKAVETALENAGHLSAAEMLNSGTWTFDGDHTRIEVPDFGKKLIALTVNPAAEKIIRQELHKLGKPTRLLVVPLEKTVRSTTQSAANPQSSNSTAEVTQ